jgi:hypothetical protein
MIIATSKSSQCLVAYLSTCEEPLRSMLYVETGYTSRLVTDDASWETIPEGQADLIEAEARGFVSGWEAKENWT